jgi:hypothetical protein
MSTWHKLSVTDFFTHSNWEGKQQATPVVQAVISKPISVSQLVETQTQTQKDKPLVFPSHLAQSIPLEGWHLLSVEEMFSRHNWDGTKPKVFTPGLPANASHLPSPDYGHGTSTVNASVPRATTSPTGQISLTLPVQDFLACMSWDGVPAIGVLPELKEPSVNNDDGEDHITLDDFSQLF